MIFFESKIFSTISCKHILGLQQRKIDVNIASLYKRPTGIRKSRNTSELGDIIIFTNHIRSCLSPRDTLKGLPWDRLSTAHLKVICKKLNQFCSLSNPQRLENIKSLNNSENLSSVFGKLEENLDDLDSETAVEALVCVQNFSPSKLKLLGTLEKNVLDLLNDMDLSCLVKLHGVAKNQTPTKNNSEMAAKTQGTAVYM